MACTPFRWQPFSSASSCFICSFTAFAGVEWCVIPAPSFHGCDPFVVAQFIRAAPDRVFFAWYAWSTRNCWDSQACWKPTVKCCPDLKVYLGGVGELQNGFMLGWYLVSLCSYIHTVFISLYFEEGVADFSPFDDVTYAHQTPTIELAIEELIEAGVWTALGVTYLTFTQLQIKAQHRETELLSEVGENISRSARLCIHHDRPITPTIAELHFTLNQQYIGQKAVVKILCFDFKSCPHHNR